MSPTPLLARLLQRHGLQSATFGSLFDIVGQSRSTFISQHGREFGEQAANLYDDALRQAVPLARRYREQRLSGPAPAALVDGQPTYQSLFGEDWRARSPEGALDADDSPVAYLCALYQWAQQMDAASDDGSGSMITLATRRPDLSALMLDKVSTDQTVTALSLVNEILCTAIETYSGKTTVSQVNSLLEATRFPFSLPYDFPNQQITRGLDGTRTTLMSLIQQLDPAWPYFASPTLSSNPGEIAQQQGSRLSTEQYALLTEAANFPATPASAPGDAASFYKTNFGVDDSSSLKTLSGFSSQTGLSAHSVQELLCSQGKGTAYSVVASPNVTYPALKAQPNQYGAVFIHGNSTTDTTIMALAADTGGNPDASTLTNTSDDRFDRMNRFIRLRNWTQLPFDQLDLLLTSTMQAEGSLSGNTQPADLLTNANSARMLGVFNDLNRQHTVSPETFAAWIHQITPYAVGDAVPFYDRLFNSHDLFDSMLPCDNSAYTSSNTTNIKQICAGLGITQAEYDLLSSYVSAKQSMTRSLPVFSAFFRLVTLPRTFGLSVTAGLGVLNLIHADAISTLAGVPPVNTAPSSSAPDVLDIIVAFAACADWLQDQQLSIAATTFMVHAPDTLIGTPAQSTLVDSIVHDLAPTLLTVGRLLAAGAPQSDSDGAAIDWATALASVLDSAGLVIDQDDLAGAIDTALAAVKTNDAARQQVKAQLLAADASQQGVTVKALADYLSTDPAFPLLLLQWGGTNSYAFLTDTLAQDAAGVITLAQDYLARLYNLGRYQAAVVTFALSSGLVQAYVTHPGWFNDSTGSNGDIPVSLGTLYRFSRYNDMLGSSTADESGWLDYLDWVNASTPPDAGDAADRLAALIDWSGSEVALAAAQMEPVSMMASTMADIDGVRRQQALWQQTGLSTDLQIQLAQLVPTSTNGYFPAGETVVSALQSRLDSASARSAAA